MSEEVKLTKEEWEKLNADMSAVTRELLTEEEVVRLATVLNRIIDISMFIGEAKEHTIFVKFVKVVDEFLYNVLPNEVYDQVHDIHDGVSDEEAERLNKTLTILVNKQVNIPWLPEIVEKEIFRLAIDIIMNGIRKGYNIFIAADMKINSENGVLVG